MKKIVVYLGIFILLIGLFSLKADAKILKTRKVFAGGIVGGVDPDDDFDGDEVLNNVDDDADNDRILKSSDENDLRFDAIKFVNFEDKIYSEYQPYQLKFDPFANKNTDTLDITVNGGTDFLAAKMAVLKELFPVVVNNGFKTGGYRYFRIDGPGTGYTWGKTEERKTFQIALSVSNPDNGPTPLNGESATNPGFKIIILRDTDKDNIPDETDPDDDNDGWTDKEENNAGTNPKDPNSKPTLDISATPEEQTIIEYNQITPIVVNTGIFDNITITPTPGITYDPNTKTIKGTPEINDWGKNEEERTITIEISGSTDSGKEGSKTVTIIVKRDTDKDKDPDVTDPDDDGDGFSDEEEKNAGTDPKDPDSYPKIKNPNTGVSPIKTVILVLGFIILIVITLKNNIKTKYFN